ncbi:MAG: nitronate monooxygenase [Bacteroidetes bacterium]|nr:MAG: nitronate monooxygenase [Bacteroidota bacterium]REK06613.1 MAG: nitronate monooxygenase [Bacteroidota bacterium]REK33379.1 MAG: nitronate monooxygenase [Bacteroidota bacterium]REK49778.1 MAG: nitronate monooxygenase [Bacteroidota bacterium]
MMTETENIKVENELTRMLNIRFPLVMAPMFLVSNEAMLAAGIEAGILACFPSLNYRNESELQSVLEKMNDRIHNRKGKYGNYGMNLIVQKANPWFKKHLDICIRMKVPVVITSLGNPESTINAAHTYGGKVFCDVINLAHAEKCAKAGCDGFVAVGQGAGGHAGPYPLILLTEALKKRFPDLPVMAAGGIANGRALLSSLASGASAGYCGTRFIASTEADVSAEYKQAIVRHKMEDIIMTSRISGTPCSVINTEFAQKIGTEQNWFEKMMSRNSKTKKYFKMLVQRRGFNWLEAAVKPGNYQNLWCAGQSVEMVDEIQSIQDIVADFIRGYFIAYNELKQMNSY